MQNGKRNLLFMSDKIFRVALIGPESTGKTFLCMKLAEHFNTLWVPEFARSYIENLDRSYTKDDVLHCAAMQLKLEDDTASKATKILFSDTEMINYKIWLEDVYDHCPDWIENEIRTRTYDHFLLTNYDIPFVDDPVRENADRRKYFFELYKTELDKRRFNYSIISGKEKDRLEQGIAAVRLISAENL